MNGIKPYRVLALAADCFGGRGGIAQSTRDLMAAMASIPASDGITILPRLAVEAVGQLPPKARQLPPQKSRLIYSMHAIWLGITLKPRIVYCGHAFMAPLALLVARLAGARMVSHVHGLEVWEPLSAVRRRALARSDLIFCVSNYTATKVVELTGVDSKRCKVIYNTIGESFTPGDRDTARRKFNVPQDSVVVTTVSRLDPRQRHKGHDRIIPLLKDLQRDFNGLMYLVAGTGDDRVRLEAVASSTGVEQIVRFLGFVADEDLPDLYRATDLYVMPSHGEGFGIAFVEAMACGTPALGLAVGGALDALQDPELGRAVSEKEFPDVLRALLRDHPSENYDLSSRTQAIFGRNQFVDRVKNAVESLMSEHSFSVRSNS